MSALIPRPAPTRLFQRLTFSGWLGFGTAISAAFLAISTGIVWGKVEFDGGCNGSNYIFLYHGMCEHVTIENEDDVKDHCTEWQDEDQWKASPHILARLTALFSGSRVCDGGDRAGPRSGH